MNLEFTPVFLFVLIAIMTAIGMLLASSLLGPKKSTAVKEMPYESGMDPIGDARQRFDVRYYGTLQNLDEQAVSFGPVNLRYMTASIGVVLRR